MALAICDESTLSCNTRLRIGVASVESCKLGVEFHKRSKSFTLVHCGIFSIASSNSDGLVIKYMNTPKTRKKNTSKIDIQSVVDFLLSHFSSINWLFLN